MVWCYLQLSTELVEFLCKFVKIPDELRKLNTAFLNLVQCPVVDRVEMELKSAEDDEVAEEAKVETKENPKDRRRVKSEISAKVCGLPTVPTDSLVPN